jgi:hypothetical protein
MIPTEIAVLRDMVFHFTQVLSTGSSDSPGNDGPTGVWIDYLTKYQSYSSQLQKHVKLGSSAKLSTVTHYGRNAKHCDSDLESFIFNNGYTTPNITTPIVQLSFKFPLDLPSKFFARFK